jgi:hypothetical protein
MCCQIAYYGNFELFSTFSRSALEKSSAKGFMISGGSPAFKVYSWGSSPSEIESLIPKWKSYA